MNDWVAEPGELNTIYGVEGVDRSCFVEELNKAIEAGLAQVENGMVVDGEEAFARIRKKLLPPAWSSWEGYNEAVDAERIRELLKKKREENESNFEDK